MRQEATSFTQIDGPLDKTALPQPVFDENPKLVDFYYLAWQQAWEHVYECPGAPISPYMGEGMKTNTIWIWDTCFMVNFCRYAAKTFPGIQSLDNFYRVMHDDEYMTLRVHHPDNPPLFAWTEYQYFKLTGDYGRLERVLKDKQYLQKHYQWLETLDSGSVFPFANVHSLWKKLSYGYMWSACPSGMDNTPRGRNMYDYILWLDAAAQQGLSALYISRLAAVMDEPAMAEQWEERYETQKTLLNDHYWCEEDGVYYDLYICDNSFCKVLTPASFWPMLAEMCSDEQAAKLVETLQNPDLLGGEIPLPTVAHNDRDFTPNGQYWLGSIWLPTTYMTVKALEKYGYHDLAAEISRKTITHMLKTYEEFKPHTIWECYSPTESKPATNGQGNKLVRTDFCGWSALGPISMFIENILGFHDIDATSQTVRWRKTHTSRHGIKNLRVGDNCVDIVSDKNGINVHAAKPFTLEINGQPYACPAGDTHIKEQS